MVSNHPDLKGKVNLVFQAGKDWNDVGA